MPLDVSKPIVNVPTSQKPPLVYYLHYHVLKSVRIMCECSPEESVSPGRATIRGPKEDIGPGLYEVSMPAITAWGQGLSVHDPI